MLLTTTEQIERLEKERQRIKRTILRSLAEDPRKQDVRDAAFIKNQRARLVAIENVIITLRRTL